MLSCLIVAIDSYSIDLKIYILIKYSKNNIGVVDSNLDILIKLIVSY